MQLYLVPSEGGAWFKKNRPWKISLWLTDRYQKRKDHKMSAGLIARRWCKTPKDLFVYVYTKHLIWIKVRTADSRVTLKFPFVSMCNKRYISKPENKVIRSVAGKTDSPVSFFLSPSGWILIWSVGACHVYLLALAFKFHERRSPRRDTFWYSSGASGPT